MKPSLLQKKRLEYLPLLPELLRNLEKVRFQPVPGKKPLEMLRQWFPRTFDAPTYQLIEGEGKSHKVKIGVFFSGGPAAGGHNVIAGLSDSGAEVVGFLNGPQGIVKNQYRENLPIDAYRNQGGFDLLGTGRTKIETEEQLAESMRTAQKHALDGLVVIGGDDSNTNAAVLAEYFLQKGCATKVIGVPKTIDGDLRSREIEISFGFDSACKTYAELIGNIAQDAQSIRKYYHFIKLMGRSASHIALECALATQPNLVFIGEERKTLDQIIQEIADLVCQRYEMGKEYGVILIPEGLIEFVPELGALVEDLHLEKDPHGNIQLSQIQTEKVILDLVKKELKKREFKGKFSAQEHFFGYEGRSCMPSNFDANYCYALGLLAAAAVREGITGAICAIQHLRKPPREWELKLIPIVSLMRIETRLNQEKPVIEKVLVDVKDKFFVDFKRLKMNWALQDQYLCPGPIQFFGAAEITDTVPLTLRG